MSSVNKVMLLGNLGQDPEVRTTQGGQMVATLSIATSKSWTDKAGQRQEKTEWHRVVCWGKVAEIAERYLRKGRQVHVEGELSYRKWDDNGVTRYQTDIVCRELTLIGGREQGQGAQQGQASGRPSQPARAPATGAGYGTAPSQQAAYGGQPTEPFDDNIPF